MAIAWSPDRRISGIIGKKALRGKRESRKQQFAIGNLQFSIFNCFCLSIASVFDAGRKRSRREAIENCKFPIAN
jgi:hypothetical protein